MPARFRVGGTFDHGIGAARSQELRAPQSWSLTRRIPPSSPLFPFTTLTISRIKRSLSGSQYVDTPIGRLHRGSFRIRVPDISHWYVVTSPESSKIPHSPPPLKLSCLHHQASTLSRYSTNRLLTLSDIPLVHTASGLYYLSELVEEHTVLARRVLARLIYAIIGAQVLLSLVDRFPIWLSLLSIGSHVVYLGNLRHFPIVKLSDPVFILSCGTFSFPPFPLLGSRICVLDVQRRRFMGRNPVKRGEE